jgi:2-dehydropantoate 2-reductase
VVPLLNGMAHIDTLDAAFGKARVMGGACQIAATLTRDGVVKSMMDVHLIIWGARELSQQENSEALGEAFAKTVCEHKVSDDIMQDMWEKVVFLSTLAGMTCLMRGSIGEIVATTGGGDLIDRYFASTCAIAEREGHPLRAPVLERFRKILGTAGLPLTASMLRDLEGGGAIEADHIVGYMLGKARHHGIDDTLLQVAYAHLKTYEERRKANRLPV